MDEPVHGVLGRDAELAQVTSFVSAPGGPSALILESTAGIGKTTLWHAACRELIAFPKRGWVCVERR
jgi:hypothetical protein